MDGRPTGQAAPDLARRRYRGLRDADRRRLDVSWGQAGSIAAPAGSIVSITTVDGVGTAWLTALKADERCFSPAAVDLGDLATRPLDPTCFDSREMAAITARRDGCLEQARVAPLFDGMSAAGERIVLRILDEATLFVIAPIAGDFVASGGGARFAVEVTPPAGRTSEFLLPEPLGRVVDEFRVTRGTASAYPLKQGQFVQIIDVEGQQCSDFMAMRAAALDAGMERHIDATVSRTIARSAYPRPGLHDKFYDQDIKPLLAVRQDTVGRHDTFALACTARGYEERGFPGHLNCSDNISEAYAPFGIGRRRAWPAINFFFNSWIDQAGQALASDEAWSRAGDYVLLHALTDLVCVSTACPDDVDPINGWNPTDIHVRIYDKDTPIAHAVSWRAEPEDAPMLTRHSPFHARTSAFTSQFNQARDLWLPVAFDATGAVGEYWACRQGATLQDMSGLRKFDIAGPDAEALLQHCLTRDVAKLAQHRALYGLICDERGSVLDDGTLFRLEPAVFRWCCGSETSALHLREQAERSGLEVHVRSLGQRMASMALQGPRSRDILRDIVFTPPGRPSIDTMTWFGFTIGRLYDRDGPMVMLSRTGFTGELGYELFCDEADALSVWDGITEAGAAHSLTLMGSAALEMLRIEAGLMVAGAEFGPDCDALEAGLGFAVDFRKEAFVGRAALARNAAAPRRHLVGLAFAGNDIPAQGDGVFAGREQVGVVTSACQSPQLGHAIAMARIAVENAAHGTALEVGKLDGHLKRLPCSVTSVPFIDPKRTKPRT